MSSWIVVRRIKAAALLIFVASCSYEERSTMELTPQDVSFIAQGALHGVLPGMSQREVRERLQKYCLTQISANPTGGDLLLGFENFTPCEPNVNLLALTFLSEPCVEGTDVPPEQQSTYGELGGFSIVFDHDVVVTANVGCRLHPEASGETAQAFLSRLLRRKVELYWSEDGQVGFLMEPTFALVNGRKIYLRYVFGNRDKDVHLTLSTRATMFN